MYAQLDLVCADRLLCSVDPHPRSLSRSREEVVGRSILLRIGPGSGILTLEAWRVGRLAETTTTVE